MSSELRSPSRSGFFVVVGHQAEQVKALLPEATFVDQKEQLGTGHAVLSAREALRGFSGDLLVLPGDVPLVGGDSLEHFVHFHRDGGYAASVLTADIADPFGYGRIVRRSDNEVDSIVEHRDASAGRSEDSGDQFEHLRLQDSGSVCGTCPRWNQKLAVGVLPDRCHRDPHQRKGTRRRVQDSQSRWKFWESTHGRSWRQSTTSFAIRSASR